MLCSPSNSALLPSLRNAPCELLLPFQALRRGPCVCSRRTAYLCSPFVCRLSPQNGGNRVWETKLQKATTRLKDATAHVSECQIAMGAAALLPWSRSRCGEPRASLLKVASICPKACRGGRPDMLPWPPGSTMETWSRRRGKFLSGPRDLCGEIVWMSRLHSTSVRIFCIFSLKRTFSPGWFNVCMY